jgi:hypothetical protein
MMMDTSATPLEFEEQAVEQLRNEIQDAAIQLTQHFHGPVYVYGYTHGTGQDLLKVSRSAVAAAYDHESNLPKSKLEELSHKLGISIDEVLSAGLVLVDLALQAAEQGKKFGVVEQDQPMITEVVGISQI